MTVTFTILGCGSSGGVPRPALGWGVCDPHNPKNRRRRTSLLVEQRGATGGTTRVLVDTSPDLREQLLDARVDWVDGVLYTHAHADHVHGIDDLRALVLHKRRRMDVYLDGITSDLLHQRFGYCFVTPPGSDYPPILSAHRIELGQPVTVDGEGGAITAMPYRQIHAEIPSLGFRFGNFAYSCDWKNIPPETAAALHGLDIWVLDALRYTPHPSHLSLAEALDWIERMKPKRAVLTNLHSDLDYETLRRELPAHVEPAFDGMKLTI